MVGKMGLEAALDDYLKGQDGLEVYQSDASGNILPGTKYTESYPEDGDNVVLTLDSNVQQTLQTSLDKSVEDTVRWSSWLGHRYGSRNRQNIRMGSFSFF